MWYELTLIVASFPLGLGLTAATIWLGRRLHWVTTPRSDRWSREPVVQFGGVPILIAFLVAAALLPSTPLLRSVVLLTAAMGLLGLWDDVSALRARSKLAAQFLLAALAVGSGVVYPVAAFGNFNALLTIIWLVGMTNAFNLLDNMDGLAAGVGVISALNLGLLVHDPGNPVAALTVTSATILLAFLVFNFQPARIFMGDTGSLAVGFFLACSAVLGSQRISSTIAAILFPSLVLFLPLFDTALVSVTRRLNGRAVSAGAKDHTSHRLVLLGMSERQAVMTLYCLSALGCLVAFLWKTVWPELGPGVLLFFAIGSILFWLYLAKLELPQDWLSRTSVLTLAIPEVVQAATKRAGAVTLDILLVVLSLYFSVLLRFEFLAGGMWTFLLVAGIAVMIKVPVLAMFSAYRRNWPVQSLQDVYPIVKATVVGSVLLITVLTLLLRFSGLSRAVFAIDLVLTTVFLIATRSSHRVFDDALARTSDKTCLLVGGTSGVFFQRYLEWSGVRGSVIGIAVPEGVAAPSSDELLLLPWSEVPCLLRNGKVRYVYLMPDCPQRTWSEIVVLSTACGVPAYAFQFSVKPASTQLEEGFLQPVAGLPAEESQN
ncbi:MAG: hypothetical protein L0387_11850 [Acidobacteria bacterium]|nr:hypothetical protein [Acidobacteriota bacterium]